METTDVLTRRIYEKADEALARRIDAAKESIRDLVHGVSEYKLSSNTQTKLERWLRELVDELRLDLMNAERSGAIDRLIRHVGVCPIDSTAISR